MTVADRRIPLPMVAVVMVILTCATAWVVLDRRAEAAEARRWKHGGDHVVVRATVGVTDGAEYGDLLAASGAPRRQLPSHVGQALVVDVAWEGEASRSGRYEFMLLDRRVEPPAILRGMEAWVGRRSQSLGWEYTHAVLADHYPWLASTASVGWDDGSATSPRALSTDWSSQPVAPSVRAREEGSATLAFWTSRRGVPVTDPGRELILAMVYIDLDDGQVQWAKQVPLTRAS